MPFGGLGGPKNDFYLVSGIHNRKGQILQGGENQTVQCNVERENVALWCGCGLPVAE